MFCHIWPKEALYDPEAALIESASIRSMDSGVQKGPELSLPFLALRKIRAMDGESGEASNLAIWLPLYFRLLVTPGQR